MVKNIIASQLRFTKGASPMEFIFHYNDVPLGAVQRVARTGNKQWQVEDEPQYFGATREEAVSKYLAADLSVALEPSPFFDNIAVTVAAPVGD